jgi:hypothetical protein
LSSCPSQRFDGVWENIIRPTVLGIGDRCNRADDFFLPATIIDDVLISIAAADYLIADLTGRNPNVYYELGFAHAWKKEVILLTRQLADVPIDLQHQRIISYTDSILGAAELKDTLKRYLMSLRADPGGTE